MQKIQVISDLHLEFSGMDRELDHVAEVERDLLIVAGDLAEGTRGIPWLRKQCEYGPVVYVAGNHEYYGHDIKDIDAELRRFADEIPNLHFLQQDVLNWNGLRIAGCTLWTDMNGMDGYHRRLLERSMTDFSGAIRLRGNRFTADMSTQLNAMDRMWLDKLEDVDIVVTHHAPTDQSITPYWREHGTLLNPGFAGNADYLIEKMRPKYWIHGHMHSFLRYWHNREVNGTQILCNPIGYGGSYQERTGWNDNLLIKL